MTPSIAVALQLAAEQLATVTDVPRFEAEVFMAQALHVSRAYLHTWPDKILEKTQFAQFQKWVARRAQGEPVSYILGFREFWSLNLIVTPDVLIPRPETELLVELVLKNVKTEQAVIADLGTGSGAIALALASERPGWTIYATDASQAALKVAKQNASRLNLTNVVFYSGDWCHALPTIKFNAIVSNPPYIATDDIHLALGDLRFEPSQALVSQEGGLRDITQIIQQAPDYLEKNGMLFLEHGYQQAKNILSIFKKTGYTSLEVVQDLAGKDRVTFASWSRF